MTPAFKRALDALEERIGYRFSDRQELVRAVSHRSSLGTNQDPADSYQRHEFLGDRVLALVVADLLFRRFPASDEGDLARRLNALVRRETCADVARALDMGEAIRLGPGERQAGGRRKEAILGDVAEAVIAAIYRDGGFEAARQFVEANWGPRMAAGSGLLRDAKTTLQEWAQGRGLPAPIYVMAGRTGPDHSPEFTVRVDIEGVVSADGTGKNKREAEQAAASAVLRREGIWTDEQ
ncbi:ribonuclease III [Methylobrevis pamukkalensis]|uniref:Ribonuclease 3 n=1 Tax=Methylobrevis pamukkalensis TaxID=1439726 RepID=A0A1E3H267_9HYPH|nr:ribonuclease III [Methylobrevis pamukkalensis]ODN70429.1 Ribonuclease 3 [Methylobrevis pamukkalensis]